MAPIPAEIQARLVGLVASVSVCPASDDSPDPQFRWRQSEDGTPDFTDNRGFKLEKM